jgi:hypothetical protein
MIENLKSVALNLQTKMRSDKYVFIISANVIL